MSKSILLSIRPEWVAKILNGEKTIEVRKQFPKNYVGWVYIYCTKGELLQRHWQKVDGIGKFITYGRKAKDKDYDSPHTLNGKVIGRFWCDKVEEIKYKIGCPFPYLDFESELPKTCLTGEELENYLFTKKGYQNGYAIHISGREIFDEPKYLTEYYKSYIETEKGIYYQVLTKAPQNYLYIEGEE
ncbi:MAG: hypothetical protein PUK09_05865 [Bacilli bacterium]|nr:hypothetical protein [Bacilli bacterium]